MEKNYDELKVMRIPDGKLMTPDGPPVGSILSEDLLRDAWLTTRTRIGDRGRTAVEVMWLQDRFPLHPPPSAGESAIAYDS